MTAPPERPPPLSVLIVDDNRDAADTLAAALGIHGFTARVAYAGPDALAAAAADPPAAKKTRTGGPAARSPAYHIR